MREHLRLASVLTSASVVAGFFSLVLASQGRIVAAAAFVAVAAVFDSCDGPVARARGTASAFGGNLDSLADMVSFGAAPALALYVGCLSGVPVAGGCACAAFAICTAWRLARFIENVRSIPADPVIVRQNWLAAYDFVTDKGAVALNDYARANDPFTKVGKIQVAIEISSVIRASNDSFRVAWIERRYENGSLAATERWTAILTVVIDAPHDAERLRKNPLGVFVHAINWSKELS